jgi:hypothetical protein
MVQSPQVKSSPQNKAYASMHKVYSKEKYNWSENAGYNQGFYIHKNVLNDIKQGSTNIYISREIYLDCFYSTNKVNSL